MGRIPEFRKATRILRTALPLLALFLLAANAWTQSADDDDDLDGPPSAMLTLHYDERGNAQVWFMLDQHGQNWAPIQTALERALHCPPGALAHPQPRPGYSRYLQSLNAQRREEYEKLAEQAREDTLEGNCPAAMTRDRWLFSTDLYLAPLMTPLKQAGESRFSVSLTFPESKYSTYTPSNTPQYGSVRSGYVSYGFDTAANAPAQIHLEYGLRSQDAIRSAALPIAFLLAPIGIMLWMQRAAVRDAGSDPIGAWFSYLRVLTWCGNGLLLLWIVGNSVRQGVEALFSYQLAGQGVEAVSLRVAIFLLPPWISYIICVLSSYRVYVHVRGEAWTRGEFFSNQLLGQATQMLPLMCLLAGAMMLSVNFRAAMGLFVGVYLTLIICTRLKLKVSGTHPEALTTGELRDRVFELAKKAVVELRQIYIMPAGKSQMANAFASRNRVVIFTDYLLGCLDKREVTAVAAHEITHIQKKHNTWKMVGFLGLAFSPGLLRGLMGIALGILRSILHAQNAQNAAGLHWAAVILFIERALKFPELDLVFYSIGLWLFFLQSRSMERVADAGAIQLTQDPEAVITSLLKLGHLNLMPIQWGPLTGSLFTHPSTLKRVERVATLGQVSPARLQQLLSHYRDLESRHREPDPVRPEQTFADAKVPANQIVSTARAVQWRLTKSYGLQFLHIALPATVAWIAYRLEAKERPLVYWVGAAVCVAIYSLVAHWMGTWGLRKLQLEFKARLEAEGVVIVERNAFLAALSPHPEPRIYAGGYDWDIGYLFLSQDKLVYAGDHLRFSLTPDQILAVRLGPGSPGWFPVPRVYVDWRDEADGEFRTWNVHSKMPYLFWRAKQQALDFYTAVKRWSEQPSSFPAAPAALRNLPAPAIGEVTGESPTVNFAIGRFLTFTAWMVLLAAAVCTALRVPAIWYVCCIVVLLRVYESLPFWRYREPLAASRQAAAAETV
jgi:Zn-dependent protease with chaperone function